MRRSTLLWMAGGLALLWIVMRSRPMLEVVAALREAAVARGLDPRWLIALALTESDAQLGAVNLGGADGKRGGSWGPTQISERTARAWGYQGPMIALTQDARLAADITAAMVAEGFAEKGRNPDPFKVERYGPPASFEDMLAIWNAGRPYAELPESGSTMLSYIPTAIEHLSSLA